MHACVYVCVHIRAHTCVCVRMGTCWCCDLRVPYLQETLKKFQTWGQKKAELAKQKTLTEKEVILAQGGDAFKQLFHQRKQQELEAQRR